MNMSQINCLFAPLNMVYKRSVRGQCLRWSGVVVKGRMLYSYSSIVILYNVNIS